MLCLTAQKDGWWWTGALPQVSLHVRFDTSLPRKHLGCQVVRFPEVFQTNSSCLTLNILISEEHGSASRALGGTRARKPPELRQICVCLRVSVRVRHLSKLCRGDEWLHCFTPKHRGKSQCEELVCLCCHCGRYGDFSCGCRPHAVSPWGFSSGFGGVPVLIMASAGLLKPWKHLCVCVCAWVRVCVCTCARAWRLMGLGKYVTERTMS